MNGERPERPAHLPPQTSKDGPPNRGGPWTQRHAAAETRLRGQLSEIAALATPHVDEPKSVPVNNGPWPTWGTAIASAILLGAGGGILIADGAGSANGWAHLFVPAIGGILVSLAGADAARRGHA